ACLIGGGGAVVGIVGVLSPAFIRIVYVVWMAAVFPIGFVVSNVVLAVVFYGVVWPIGILTRLTGRDALQLRFDREAKTYWNARQPTRDPRRYFRQY
ncbi:MAG: SxtJ family membrane protein, partial [Planctomycetota bacterium]|nr:SxtJ family membrane protein [Planctomycetota bacterium]